MIFNPKVGDELILVSPNRYGPDREVLVARIGRRYLYVAHEGSAEFRMVFDRATGVEQSSYGVKSRLYTPDGYADLKLRQSRFEQLRLAGVTLDWKVRERVTADQLKAILDVIGEVTE